MKFTVLIVVAALILLAAWWKLGGDDGNVDKRYSVQSLYPYVIPEQYPVSEDAGSIVRPLGHGLRVTLVFDVGGTVINADEKAIERLGLTPEQAHARAIANLEHLAEARQIKMAAFPNGPSGKPFILVGGHWAAATSILLPRLKALVEGPLGPGELYISVPHREAMLIFPAGDQAHREAIQAFVKKNESYGNKALTFGLFTFTTGGVKPIADGEAATEPSEEPSVPSSGT